MDFSLKPQIKFSGFGWNPKTTLKEWKKRALTMFLIFYVHPFYLKSCFIDKEQKREFELIGLKSYHNSNFSKNKIEYWVGIELFIIVAQLGAKQGT